jgi:hypothetical protein
MVPNVLVVVLDSVRARNTSLHGYTHRTTPVLERLGADATVYEFAYAPSTTSVSSHVSMFTGRHEDDHRTYDGSRAIDPPESVWASLRDEHDYRTGLFTVNPQFHKPVGLCAGFERQVLAADSEPPYPEATDPGEIGVPDWFPLPDLCYRGVASALRPRPVRTLLNGVARYRGADPPSSTVMIDRLFEWVDAGEGPWAGFLNLMDAHAPYRPQPRHDYWGDEELREVQRRAGGGHHVTTVERLREGSWWHPSALEHLYDGAIRQADAMVGRLVRELRRRGAFEETLFVVTADHGEAFGEPSRLHENHHLFGHAPGVHEVQTHVPLVVSGAGGTGDRVERPASLTLLPRAIEHTVDEGFEPGLFCPSDGRVLVSRGCQDDHRHRLDDGYTAGDRVALPTRLYAGYERVDGQLRKYCRAGDDAATVRVGSAQASRRLSTAEPGVREWFPGPGAGWERDREGELSDAARERLEAFGYVR